MAVIRWRGFNLISKFIYDVVHQLVLAEQRNFLFCAVVHIKYLTGKVRQIKVLWLRHGIRTKNTDRFHPVHSECSNALMFFAKANRIIMIFIPHKVVRGEMITLAVIIRDFLPILIIVIIQERDLFALIDCRIDIVYQIVNLLVHRFDTLGNIDIPFQFFRLIHACHLR